MIGDSTELTKAELRRRLRELPAQRRRDVARAVREGRAVGDPRDADLAVARGRRVQAAPWIRWALPETRPHGRRAALWIAHGAWVLVAAIVALVLAWSTLGIARWVFAGLFAYAIVTSPWAFSTVLRTRWNAPEAERRNRELLDSSVGR